MNFITTCTVLLAVFVIHSAYGFDEVFKNKDCPGNEIYKFEKSLIDCMAECNKETKCIGIVHKKKTCRMKSKCDERKFSRGSIIYLKPTGGFNFKKSYTCPGNDVAIIGEKITRAECMIQCNENIGCIAVTYTRRQCWGKSECNATVKNEAFNTYFKQRGDTEIITNMNCPGNDINKDGMEITLEQCIQLCEKIPMCVGVVYSENTCWLKLQCTTREANTSSTIHMLSSSTEIILDRNCPLNDILDKRMEITLPECIQLCGDIPECNAIVYSEQKYCWLKTRCPKKDREFDNSVIYSFSKSC